MPIRLCAILICLAASWSAYAQPAVQFPTGIPSTIPSSPWSPSAAPGGMFPAANNPGMVGVPGPFVAPSNMSPIGAPSVGTFDPYAPTFRPSTAPVWGSGPAYPTSTPNWGLGNLFNWNNSAAPSAYGPPVIPPGLGQPLNYPPTGAYPNSAYPNSIYPNAQPNVLFPTAGVNTGNPWGNGTVWGPTSNSSFGPGLNNWWNSTSTNIGYGTNQVMRLYQGVRFRHTFLPGSGDLGGRPPSGLESNDSEVSLVFAIPSFLSGTQPLYIIPSYTQHVWEGPSVPGTDLPGSAFSAFLDSSWETNPMQTLGAELGARVGVFSAFDAINSNSIRIQGKALGRLRLTPTATLRAGAYYIDRNKYKILPAGGILWIPNPDTRFDIFFPEPKLAHYVSTLGTADLWWYITGYYGGGAWTIKQTDGSNDEIDINDLRVMLGVEWGRSDLIRQGYRVGFFEAGFAFNRELLYRVRDTSNINMENSLVFRAGFGY